MNRRNFLRAGAHASRCTPQSHSMSSTGRADKIAMANLAQTINCIHPLFPSQGDRFARAPVCLVFEMYRNHMQSRLASMRIRCDEIKVPASNGALGAAAWLMISPRSCEGQNGLASSPAVGTEVATNLMNHESRHTEVRVRLEISAAHFGVPPSSIEAASRTLRFRRGHSFQYGTKKCTHLGHLAIGRADLRLRWGLNLQQRNGHDVRYHHGSGRA